MRWIATSLSAALVALSPLAAVAASGFASAPQAAPGHIVRVQGWWEEEHREEAFRDRYWRLPPERRERYDRLEYQIRELQERQRHEVREGDRREFYQIGEQIEQLRREQYRLLQFWE